MRILVVDGNSIVNRAFYGIRPLTNKDGQFTHAIYGFLNMLNKIERDENPDAVAIAFDLKAPTFRHKAYDGYKANRKGMPPELASQMPVLKELLTLLGYKLVTCEGFEADDILGTFADACEHNSDECVIATGDRDSLQLVSDETVVHLCTNKGDLRYTPEKIMEEYGVTPSGLIEIKAIQGDSSDNIPGVAGIGPKGAGDLIKRFKTVEEVYENIDSPEIKDGVRKKLIASKDNAILSRMLGEIVRNVPIDTDVSRYKVVCEEPSKALALMQKLELFSLIEKYKLSDVPVAAETKAELPTLTVCDDTIPVNELIGEVYLIPEISKKEVKSFSILYKGKIYVSDDAELFAAILQNPEIRLYTTGCKTLFAYADKNGFEIVDLAFDVELAAYLLQPSEKDYSDETLCTVY
ncbi:MAG: DNA polymerase I, partial [Ruminococcus sp.]|nr:DNA polymerase I [Ruminococcus sp.]